MPTYLLDGHSDARIANGPVKIEAHASNGVAFVLTAKVDGAILETITPSHDILIVKRVDRRVVISLSPASPAQTFPPGTVMNFTVGVDGPARADPERAVLSGVDASGLGVQDLLSLEPVGDYLSVTPHMSHSPVSPLVGVAKAAEVATRELLGSERVDTTSSVNVVAAVDGSASMLWAWRDGSVRAVLEILVGVSRVISPDRLVVGAVVTDGVEWIALPDAGHLAASVEAAQATATLGTVFHAGAPALAGRFPNQNTITYLLTDALPVDLDELIAADATDGEVRHLIVLSDPLALSVQGDSGVPLTQVTPVDHEEGLAGRLEFDPVGMRALVKSLLAACFVPGTVYAKKVSS